MSNKKKAPAKDELIQKLMERADESENNQEALLEKIKELQEKQENILVDVKENVDLQTCDLKRSIDTIEEKLGPDQSNKFEVISSSKEEMLKEITSIKDTVQCLESRVDELSEKLYDFEQSKRNNLIFYGVPSEQRETPTMLMQKVMAIIRGNLMLKREIVITKASRIYTGPEVSGCRPLVITFEDFKDREEVLRKSTMLKGSNIRITEDMSRRVRENRAELRRFLRAVKKNNPAASCFIQYDKLFIDNKIYVFNDLQGKVVEYSQVAEDDEERTNSSLHYNSLSSLTKSKKHSSSSLQRTQSLNIMEEENDMRMQQLEEALDAAKEAGRKHEEEKVEALSRMKEMEKVMEKLRIKLAQCDDTAINGMGNDEEEEDICF